MDSTLELENTLGIDCYKFAELGRSGRTEETDSPRRLSADFFNGLIGTSPPHKRRRGNEKKYETSQRILRNRTSTPRRSIRLQAAEKVAVKDAEKVSKKAKVIKPKPIRPLAQPRSNKTIELRKQAMQKAQKQSEDKKKQALPSKSKIMKPNFTHKQQRPHYTVPKTPEMIRRLKQSRIRPNYHKTIKEKEDEEVQKMKSYKFKAQPVPKAVKKAPPKPSLPHKPPTVPKSPNITLRKKRKIDEVDPHVEFKAKPLPTFRKVPLIRKSEMSKTSVKPFSFDSKYADPNINKKKLMEEELSKLQKAREFKAQPVPVSNAENMPPRTVKPRSVLPTFELPGDQVSKKKKLAFQNKLDEAANKRISEAQFKSREPSVLRKKPFKPVL